MRSAYTTRPATLENAPAIAAIYNEGIADRVATFETEPRMPADIAAWFRLGAIVMVAETRREGVVAFAASFPYSARPCYAGIHEFSIYTAREQRGRGAERAALPENAASRGLLREFGFAEIGLHRRHGKLGGEWRDCVIVELLMGEAMA
jgi:L-amino acid N-acyltransferase YncA